MSGVFQKGIDIWTRVCKVFHYKVSGDFYTCIHLANDSDKLLCCRTP
jgi:hypothetical protein